MPHRPLSRALVVLAILVALGAIGFGWLAWRPAKAPLAAVPRPESFPAELVQRGAALAALGDCNTCHTAPGGRPLAGGLPLPTPFGTIYSTNITPDPETGIGRWPEAAFRRAMREGVDREGRHLYPAFPYDHFTLVSDEDDVALYAYLMTRQAVVAKARQNELAFPISVRTMLAGWKLLFLSRGPYRPDPAHDASWNRGAYLVEGLGHCGACHTPRNLLGAERTGELFAGGDAEGWRAFAINGDSPSPVPWSAEALGAYLRQGWHGLHGIARGPMQPVTQNLSEVSDADIAAMATYIASIMGEPSQERLAKGEALAEAQRSGSNVWRPQSAGSQTVAAALAGKDQGEAIYAGACAGCHESGRPVPYGGLSLSLSTAINSDNPRNLINTLLAGVAAADGVKAPIMPGFAATLTDEQAVSLVTYLRSRFSGRPAWSDVVSQLQEARRSRPTVVTSNASSGR